VVLERHVLAIDVAGLAKAFPERRGIARGVLRRPAVDDADDWQPSRLRARRKRTVAALPSSVMNARRPMKAVI
jgi:hypothetical protein